MKESESEVLKVGVGVGVHMYRLNSPVHDVTSPFIFYTFSDFRGGHLFLYFVVTCCLHLQSDWNFVNLTLIFELIFTDYLTCGIVSGEKNMM
jgi:hypothetical protein